MKRHDPASIDPAARPAIPAPIRALLPATLLVASALLGPAVIARQAAPGRAVRNAVWGVEVRVPDFEAVDHPLKDQANFVLAGRGGTGACRMNLSLFVAAVKDGATPEECRSGDIADPEAIAVREDAELVDQESGAVAWSLFDQNFVSSNGARTTFHQLYGYKTRGDLCFQMHLSSGDACTDFPKKAKAVLGSLHLERDAGATLETAELARRDGGDPRDWKLHLRVADNYLRDETRPIPARARRFYESALRLGAASLRPADRFAVESGSGLAWLQEERPEDAIPRLKRALQAAQRAGITVPHDAVRETVYALASAHALTGDLDASCDEARAWFKGADQSALKPAAKRIRKDSRMDALTGSECYRTLLNDLGLH